MKTFWLFEQTNDFIQYVKRLRQIRNTVRTEVGSVLRCVDKLSSGGSGYIVSKLSESVYYTDDKDACYREQSGLQVKVVELKELIAVDLPLH